MSRISITEKNHVCHVELTRVEKKNAMDDAMIDALIEAGSRISTSNARAVVISGAGDCFCAGIDISSLTKMAGQDMDALMCPRTHGSGTTNRWQEVSMVWHRMDIPVFAALHGAVFGAGLQLALGADIRIAAPHTQLAVMEMKWGLVPDMGGMVLLPRLLREDVMKKLIFSANPIPADQALQWGLVTEIANDPRAVAFELAESVTRNGPNAIRAAKRLIHLARTDSVKDVLLAESKAQAALLGKPEQMEVIAAQFGKRDPVFD